jgi:hypothetical protein
MIASIDKLIELTREQAKTMQATQHSGGRGQGDEREEAPSLSHTPDDLDIFIGRLRQIKEGLGQDPQLRRLVDAQVSQHVRCMEKHQSSQNIWLSVITTLVGAILGRLTSTLASPMTL